MFNSHSAKDILRRIESTFETILNEPDEQVQRAYMIPLAELKDAVNALDQENEKFFSKVFHGVIRDKYGHLYDQLNRLWASYKRDSENARLCREATERQRAMESSPSLELHPHQQLQGHGSQAASRSTAAMHNVPRNPSRPTWRSRVFPRRDPTSDTSTQNQPSSLSSPGLNTAPSAEQQQAPVQGHTWGGHLSQRGAPTNDGRAHQFVSSNTSGSNMAPSTQQQQTHLPGSNWGGQQYGQPQHGRGAPTRGGSMHQFAPPNAPGPNMAPSSEQHRAYVPEHITNYQEREQVEHQVNEEWERRLMVAQNPGRPGMGQYSQPNILPQGQYSLPPPPRPAQHQSAAVQREAQPYVEANAHAGPSHTRSPTATSRNTFGHGLPGQPGIGEPGPSQYYDRRGDSFDSDGNTIPRTSYSSEGSYHYRY